MAKRILSADRRAQLAKYESLEKVLKKLDEKEAVFRETLDGEKDKERRRELQRKIEVIEAQRKKGEKLRKKLEDLRGSE